MSAAPKLEVAKDGVVRIPKSVFESDPAAAPAPAGGPVTTVRRLDGTIQTLEKIGVNNPNFVARKAWPGGNIVTSNKDAALIKYYERKGMPLPAHLQEKRDEVLSSEEAKNPSRSKGAKGKGGAKAKRRTPVQQRLGTAAGVKGGAKAPGRMPVQERLGTSAPVFKPSADHAKWAASRPKGGIVKLSGADGATGRATVVAPVQGAGARGADAAAARKERPKGGVRILSGAEGGLANGKKRPLAEEEQGLSKSSRC